MFDKIVNAVAIRNSKHALLAQLDAVLNYPVPNKIAADFDKPTLVISGSEDILVEPDDVRQLARLCKARHKRLAKIGHSIPAEDPEVFQRLVLEFLDSGA